MNALFENLFDDYSICAGAVSREDFMLTVAGAKAKFPRSLLSMYRVVPRTMSRYDLKPLGSEFITGVVFTTVFNVRRNLGIDENSQLTRAALEKYFLDKSNEVLTLMTHNTDLNDIVSYRARNRKISNPVVFRSGSIPLMLVFTSRKKIDIYKEDTGKTNDDNSYTRISPNVAVSGRYAGISLLDVHSPGTALMLSTVYGVDSQGLNQLSDVTDLSQMQQVLQEPIKLDVFRSVFEGVKKSVPLTNISEYA